MTDNYDGYSSKIESLRSREDFTRCYKMGTKRVNRSLVLYSVPNNEDITRIGFSISRKLGKAVNRNKMKRRLRKIVCEMEIKKGYDHIIAPRYRAKTAGYKQLSRELCDIFAKADMIRLKNE